MARRSRVRLLGKVGRYSCRSRLWVGKHGVLDWWLARPQRHLVTGHTWPLATRLVMRISAYSCARSNVLNSA